MNNSRVSDPDHGACYVLAGARWRRLLTLVLGLTLTLAACHVADPDDPRARSAPTTQTPPAGAVVVEAVPGK